MGRGTPIKKGRGERDVCPETRKGRALKMYIRNTQVN